MRPGLQKSVVRHSSGAALLGRTGAASELFRRKHRGCCCRLPPWDAMSARVFVAAGFEAIATTQRGLIVVARLCRRRARALERGRRGDGSHRARGRVPVTADIEGGFRRNARCSQRSVAEIIACRRGRREPGGRDAGGSVPIRSVSDAAERIRAAREAAKAAGVPIVDQCQDRSLSAQHRRRSLRGSTRPSSAAARISPPGPIASIRSGCATPQRWGGW